MALKATFEGNLLANHGMSWHDDDRSQYSFSPLGVVTFGFLYALSDIWEDAENCAAVTWAECDCADICE